MRAWTRCARPSRIAAGADLVRESSRVAYLRGCLEFARGDVRASNAAQAVALERARAAGDAECEAHALSGLADVLYAEGRMQSSYDAFERCVALCDRLGLARFALNNRCMLAVAHAYLDPADGALGVVEQVRSAARQLRQPSAEVMADESEAWVRVVQGRFPDVIVPAERSLALAREIGSRRWMMFDLGLLTFAYWNVGRRDEAQEALRQVFEIMPSVGERFFGSVAHGARAMMAERAGDLRRILADGERSLAQGAPAHGHFWYRSEAIEALLREKDFDGVLWQASALENFTRAERVPWVEFQVRRARALAAAGSGAADAGELTSCRERAHALSLARAIPAIDDALAAVGAGAKPIPT